MLRNRFEISIEPHTGAFLNNIKNCNIIYKLVQYRKCIVLDFFAFQK